MMSDGANRYGALTECQDRYSGVVHIYSEHLCGQRQVNTIDHPHFTEEEPGA